MLGPDIRQPKYLGSGYFFLMKSKDFVKGDTAFDVDYGHIKWDGNQWVQIH